jgi:hypothetical protein
LSYDNLVGHVSGYFGVLSNLPSYDPNEADLKLPALQAFADDLRAKNDAVSSTFVPLSQARGLRDQLLYQADNSVVNTALKPFCHVPLMVEATDIDSAADQACTEARKWFPAHEGF